MRILQPITWAGMQKGGPDSPMVCGACPDWCSCDMANRCLRASGEDYERGTKSLGLSPSDRQPELEREFLKGAERLAGLDTGWATSVEDRLLRMERTKGRDSFKDLGLKRILGEIDEECLDLGGWPVLAALLSYTAGLDDDTAHEVRLRLQTVAAYGVRAAAVVSEIRELCNE